MHKYHQNIKYSRHCRCNKFLMCKIYATLMQMYAKPVMYDENRTPESRMIDQLSLTIYEILVTGRVAYW